MNIVCTSDGGDGLPPLDDAGLPDGFLLPSDSRLRAVVSFALAQRGKPYVWGAEGPDSYDCSGLTMAAWAKGGVQIPRVTADQLNTGITVPSLATLRPGDLVFIPGSDGTMTRPATSGCTSVPTAAAVSISSRHPGPATSLRSSPPATGVGKLLLSVGRRCDWGLQLQVSCVLQEDRSFCWLVRPSWVQLGLPRIHAEPFNRMICRTDGCRLDVCSSDLVQAEPLLPN
ncbi:NlpC/P60 family protein [Micromonospora sp. M12]